MAGAYLHGFDETTGAKVMCRVTVDGKLIVNAANILENPPTEDEALKAPTSEWAFDHDADADAHHTPTVAGDLNHQDLANRSADDHHAKYTDAESRAAIGDLFNNVGVALKDLSMGYKAVNYANPFTFRAAASDTSQISFTKSSGYQILSMACNYFGTGLVNFNIRIFNGSAYTNIIRQDTFQAELDNYLENPPTEDEDEKASTSEWAFDHDADASRHHAKYTDGEALAAPSSSVLTLDAGTYNAQSVDGISIIRLRPSGGDITLNGLADGYNYQIIWFIRVDTNNNIILNNNSGVGGVDEKFYTRSQGNETQVAGNRGGFRIIHNSGVWIVDQDIT